MLKRSIGVAYRGLLRLTQRRLRLALPIGSNVVAQRPVVGDGNSERLRRLRLPQHVQTRGAPRSINASSYKSTNPSISLRVAWATSGNACRPT